MICFASGIETPLSLSQKGRMAFIFGRPVCPRCVRELTSYNIDNGPDNPIAPMFRRYYGWCDRCEQGCEVEQFKKGGRWHIHKWRPFFCSPGQRPTAGEWLIKKQLLR